MLADFDFWVTLYTGMALLVVGIALYLAENHDG